MSTVQDFEDAPVGATATSPEGKIAVKTGRRDLEWSVYDPCGWYHDNYRSAEMVRYTLNPVAPKNSREALDLAWELAHEVKEGQTIPEGTKYLEVTGSGLKEYISHIDFEVVSWLVGAVRTHDPLPDPGPDWLDAPAVVAFVKGRDGDPQVFTRENETGTQWLRDTKIYHWYELVGVVPLYPKEG